MKKLTAKKLTEFPFECACGYISKLVSDIPKTPEEVGPLIFQEFMKHNETCPLLKRLLND